MRLTLLWLAALLTAIYSAMGLEPVALTLLSSTGLLIAILVTCAAVGLSRKPVTWRTAAGAAGALGLWLSVVATDWPLRASFRLSQPFLLRLVESAGAQGQPKPTRAGVFAIQAIDTHSWGGLTCLWIGGDSGGRTGLAYSPGKQPERAGTWSSVRLSSEWALVSED